MDWNRFISPKSQGVEVSLTTYCNANCPLCARTDPFTGVKKESIPLLHISFDVYKKFVDEIKPDPDDSILLCGDYGDPMMHPKVEDIIDYTISKYNSYVAMDTNGGVRSTDFYKRIAQKYKDKVYINFSIDGFNSATNEQYRVDVDFDKAIENLKTFAKYNPWSCTWQMLLFTYNYHQVDQVAEFCEQHKIFFDFKMNTRSWKFRKIEDDAVKELVKQKQEKYKYLMPNAN